MPDSRQARARNAREAIAEFAEVGPGRPGENGDPGKSAPGVDDPEPDYRAAAPDAAAAIAAMDGRARRIADAEVDAALAKLEAAGGVTSGQREAVEALATGIVAGLLDPPRRRVLAAARRGEGDAIAAAVRLFADERGRER
ncbi:hypothetical protein [Halegenticoccus soli]|uniref:hypothetical protein n=1 Tax=Halegenticoccus soli TaxID=1985678 RepID=UPI000C6EF092|nr:hypothetical protein [Halegenticoccus soli]